MSISTNHTLTTVEAYNAIMVAAKMRRPMFLWGSFGIGKSDLVRQACNDMGGLLIDLRLSQCDQTDLRGIPYFNKETCKMEWAPPVSLPDQETANKYPIVFLFLDEMNSAAPATQAAAYQLILDRKVGEYTLPDNVIIIAAGNRESDKGVTYRMPMPLANRFVHAEIRVDFDSWSDWALSNNVHPDVVGYLTWAKNDLSDFDPKSSSRACASPRSWKFVSDFCWHEMDDSTRFNMIAGSIGEGLAAKFFAHRKISSKLPNPSDILTGKVKTLENKEISVMYSLVTSLCYELRNAANDKTVTEEAVVDMMENYISYIMENFQTELIIMSVVQAMKTHKLQLHKARKNMPKFNEQYRDVISAGFTMK